MLSDIIEPRVEEIFAVLRKRIEDTGLLEQLSAGVVLTGGAVLLDGMTEFAEEILGMPVRLGFPWACGGSRSSCRGRSTRRAWGWCKYGARSRRRDGRACGERRAGREARSATATRELRACETGRGRRPTRRKFWEWLRAAF